jgi:hypothetical protein
MIQVIAENRVHRCNDILVLHVVDIMNGALQ